MRTTGKVRTDFLVFGSPVIGEAEIAEVVDSLRSGWIGTGPKVQRFERALEEYIGVDHVRCVSSCTASLMLGLLALGVGEGDEVLLPTMTFAASANAVLHTGALPVFVDSEPSTGLIDLDAAEAAITPRTKAIMPVHLSGRPVDLDRLAQLADRHGLLVVEDAAHAIGTEWRGRRIGSFGNVTAFSFYATKNITTAEGGALATPDPEIAERIERLSLHGLSTGAWRRYSDAGFRHYDPAPVRTRDRGVASADGVKGVWKVATEVGTPDAYSNQEKCITVTDPRPKAKEVAQDVKGKAKEMKDDAKVAATVSHVRRELRSRNKRSAGGPLVSKAIAPT